MRYGEVYRDTFDGETLMVICREEEPDGTENVMVRGLVIVVRDNLPSRSLGDVGDTGTVVSRNVEAWERLDG